MKNLKDKVAFVTGGASGIGFGIVKTFLDEGMRVAVADLRDDHLDEAREALYASQASRLPVGHVADAEEIAEGYLYLMRQTYVTGQLLAVDGGGLLV